MLSVGVEYESVKTDFLIYILRNTREEVNIKEENNNKNKFDISFRKRNYYYKNKLKLNYPKSCFMAKSRRCFEWHGKCDKRRYLSYIQQRVNRIIKILKKAKHSIEIK